jgi:4-hydroxyacetophenone monooxygenase
VSASNNEGSSASGGTAITETVIRGALEFANLNVLRMAVYQVTRDPELAKMTTVTNPLRGGALYEYLLDPKYHDRMKDKAVEYLLAEHQPTAKPSDTDVRRMMDLMTGIPVSDERFAFGREELALEEVPRGAAWTNNERPTLPADFSVTIIGAGASGLAAAVQFERLGIPYVIYERQDDLGGTWYLNQYPDARVDTTSFLYQFKFDKNYPWSEYFGSQPELQRYLHHIATTYGVYDRIRFRTELKQARYDEAGAFWQLELIDENGTPESVRTSVIVSACGFFNTAKTPDIPGVASFLGESFHTTEWDPTIDVDGKTVAVIGNGSTGVQTMPAIARTAGQVYVFQRTPQWISPMPNYREPLALEVRWLMDHVPYYWNWYIYSSQMTVMAMQDAQVIDPEWQRTGGLISRPNDNLRASLTQFINDKVGHLPGMAEKVRPNYAPLARRLIVDNGWYDALGRDNVELVTEPIEKITEHGIRTTDGQEREVDVILYAVGFDVERYMWPVEYVGRDGVTLEELWQRDGARAYAGLTLPGFPNLFVFYGPQSQPRAGAMPTWMEIWARYAAQAVVGMIERGMKSVEVKRQVFDDYNTRLDEATTRLVWETGAPADKNYYVNRQGRQFANMPLTLEQYFALLAEPSFDDFECVLRD